MLRRTRARALGLWKPLKIVNLVYLTRTRLAGPYPAPDIVRAHPHGWRLKSNYIDYVIIGYDQVVPEIPVGIDVWITFLEFLKEFRFIFLVEPVADDSASNEGVYIIEGKTFIRLAVD